MKNLDDFVRGIKDCEAGIPHQDLSPEYTEGYRKAYEQAAVADAKTNGEHDHENQ